MDYLDRIIGSDAESILWWQMVIRGVLIFLYTLVLVRFGGRRIFGKNTGFDIVLGVILGSIMSRALTANAKFLPTIAAATTLVLLHQLLAMTSRHFRPLGKLVKGTEVRLIAEGRILRENLRKVNLTEKDLAELLRLNGGTAEVDGVQAAYLERNGDVSVIRR